MSQRQYRPSGTSRNKSNNIPFNLNNDQGGESVLTLNFQIPPKHGSQMDSQHRMGGPHSTPSLRQRTHSSLRPPQMYDSHSEDVMFNNEPRGFESDIDQDDGQGSDLIDPNRNISGLNASNYTYGRQGKSSTSRKTQGTSRQLTYVDDGNGSSGRMASSRMRTTGSNFKSQDDMDRRGTRSKSPLFADMYDETEASPRGSRPNIPSDAADYHEIEPSNRGSRTNYETDMDESEGLEPIMRTRECNTCVGEDDNYVCKPRYSKSKMEQEKKPLRFSECYENKFKELDSVRCEYEKQLWCLQKQLDKERRCTMEEFNTMQQEYCQYDKALEMYALRVAMDQIAISKANLEHEYADKIRTEDGRGGDMEHPCCSSMCPPPKPACIPCCPPKPPQPFPEPPPLPPIPMYPPPLPLCPPRRAEIECCPEQCCPEDDAALKITHRQLTVACVVCAVILLFLTVRFSSLVRVLILGSGSEESES